VTTMVDRITPHTTDDDRAAVRDRAGVDDPVPVVTEPYVEWVLSGAFPAGRPRWEDVGARFVDDITPWEHRKLWLLNGSHLLLAYAGTLRGHDTVSEAVADPVLRGWVEQWWDDAARHLPLPDEEIAAYRGALLERYANPRIRHLLRQIAADGSQKVPIRILPTVRADLAQRRVPTGAARVLAAWVCHLRGHGAPVADVAADEFTALAAGDLDDAVRRVLARFGVDDERLLTAVTVAVQELGG
jgi:fructuronate reductase